MELACLNAGITTSTADIAALTAEEYQRVVAVNVDGVVFGVRRLARELEDGDAIVVTASLAGLTGVEGDPIYSLTKHAIVGFVRSVAPQLAERGIRINAVCPGFADTPMVAGELRASLEEAGFPLLRAEEVAEAVLLAARSEGTGEAWVVQPGRQPEPYRFRGIPGPRVPARRVSPRRCRPSNNLLLGKPGAELARSLLLCQAQSGGATIRRAYVAPPARGARQGRQSFRSDRRDLPACW